MITRRGFVGGVAGGAATFVTTQGLAREQDPGEIRVNFTYGLVEYVRENVFTPQYKCVLPMPDWMYELPLRGTIVSTELDPWWFVPVSLQREYGYQEAYPPGHPRNAMGACKIRLAYDGRPDLASNLIHGGAKEVGLGKRLSHGCIRMRDPDILEMVGVIDSHKPRVHFFT